MEKISISGYEGHADGPAEGWRAMLEIDGQAVASIESRAAGGYSVASYMAGFGPDDLDALDRLLRTDGSATLPGGAPERAETLADRVADLVALAHLEAGVAAMLETHAVAAVQEDGRTVLLQVAVPAGASLDDAVRFLEGAHPHAAILNRMGRIDAAAAYVRHAG